MTVNLSQSQQKSEIYFCPQEGKSPWAIKITSDGIVFNREEYSLNNAEDFAKCFMDILEKNYDVKFYKKFLY